MYILDTNVLIWFFEGNRQKLGKNVVNLLENPENEIWISVVSLWEIYIQIALGKLEIPDNLLEKISDNGFRWLSIEVPHIKIIPSLPLIHHDPFDRLLIAQTISTNWTLVTKNRIIPSYPVIVISQG